jgi:methylase of polypeptide subunit release factors
MEADAIHRRVWNQDVVPFVIVHTPKGIKLYSGFCHGHTTQGDRKGILGPLRDFNGLSDVTEDLSANSIDTGSLWHKRGRDVTPADRVNWRLLDNLRTLDRWLQIQGVDQGASHALIGKYVYLHYLRDRGILSPKKLGRWGIDEASVFGARATIDGLRSLIGHLDDWLNGSVFPLNLSRPPFDEVQLRCVAGIFRGDDIREIGDRQLSLDFEAYDFSYIPIETLSVVYEQFLHAPVDAKNAGDLGQRNRGREIGAYYTPIPVVNLMLSELEERRPLGKGMRVLDPSCGSGAFLVQCYRRLIEKEFPPGSTPKPSELRDLLKSSIFGVDVESDACNVAELSLILTLLDYVDPPDLEGPRNKFKLPALRGTNIFCANFFGDSPGERPPESSFDWVVGNPPWKRLTPSRLLPHERRLWKWMKAHVTKSPVGGNQAARAFAWEAVKYLAPTGEIAMFLPAMTLFENTACAFRKAFFQRMKVNTIVNLANLAEVLSAGRFRVPGAAFFYRPRTSDDAQIGEDEVVRVYSPLVANQESTRPVQARTRNESWSILINASEIRDIAVDRVAGGSGLPWKLAAWGSSLDQRLLAKLEKRFPLLGSLEKGVVVVAEGPALEEGHVADGDKKTTWIEEVVGQKVVNMAELARWRNVFSFPQEALRDNDKCYASKRRGSRGLAVCRPPHVIVSAARNFAVFSDDYLIVPPRQIGIVSTSNDEDFLKALSLYLSSDFAFYHQFLTSSQFGVQRGRATLHALRRMPIGIAGLGRHELREWSRLHGDLVRSQPGKRGDSRRHTSASDRQRLLLPPEDDGGPHLLSELNRMVADSLNLTLDERTLIHDLVNIRLALNDGKTGASAVGRPETAELEAYARRLKTELDAFIGRELPKCHWVDVIHDDLSGMVQIDLKDIAESRDVRIVKADDPTSADLECTRARLRTKRSQWVYFDRNLRIYEGTRTFVFKPMQRFQWTESQAMIDAREVIAETLEG